MSVEFPPRTLGTGAPKLVHCTAPPPPPNRQTERYSRYLNLGAGVRKSSEIFLSRVRSVAVVAALQPGKVRALPGRVRDVLKRAAVP